MNQNKKDFLLYRQTLGANTKLIYYPLPCNPTGYYAPDIPDNTDKTDNTKQVIQLLQ